MRDQLAYGTVTRKSPERATFSSRTGAEVTTNSTHNVDIAQIHLFRTVTSLNICFRFGIIKLISSCVLAAELSHVHLLCCFLRKILFIWYKIFWRRNPISASRLSFCPGVPKMSKRCLCPTNFQAYFGIEITTQKGKMRS